MDLLSDFACLTAALYPKRAGLNGNESPEMAPAEVVALLAGVSIVIESLAASGEGGVGDSGPAEQPEACEQPWSDAGE